jgi:Icc-related predicted phosphoesterase
MSRTTQILCVAEPEGRGDAVEHLLEATGERGVDAIALIGGLTDGGAVENYRTLFRTIGASGLPTYWIPGPTDAPVAHYLREAQNVEVVFPTLHGVHGTAAFSPDRHVVFAGLGGEVDDDPDAPREELERLSYPRWEAEYRLKLLGELPGHELVLMFSTPPAHKGAHTRGSEALAEVVKSHRPRLVVSGGPQGTAMLGRSLLVAPGPLSEGHYAIADLHSHEVALEQLSAVRA